MVHNQKFSLLFSFLSLAFVALVLTVLVGCAPEPTPTAITIPTSTLAPTATVTSTPFPIETPTITPTPTPSLIVGKRIITVDEVKNGLGDEPITFTEREALIQGQRVKYYDVSFDKWNRKARMVGQIPISAPDKDQNNLTLKIEGFVAYVGTGTLRWGMPLLYSTNQKDSSVIPVAYLPDEESAKTNSAWRIGLYDEHDGKQMNWYFAFYKLGNLALDMINGRFGDNCGLYGTTLVFKCSLRFLVGDQIYDPIPPVATIEDIQFFGEFSSNDMTYFGNNLDLLKTYTPAWWQYIMDAKPFVVLYRATSSDSYLNIAATGWCCDPGNTGRLDVASHFSNSQSTGRSEMWYRLNFWTLLVHEVTHIQDLRWRRFARLFNKDYCRAVERSAVTKELDFVKDLYASSIPSSYSFYLDYLTTEKEKILAKGTFDWAPGCT